MRIILALSIFFFFSNAHAIQNGQVPGPDHPATGNTILVMTPTKVCSGAIIAEDLILTAAHCLDDVSAFYVLVYFATPHELVSVDRSRLDPERMRGAVSVEIPEDFATYWGQPGLWGTSNFYSQSDIAIVKLAEPMPTSVSHDPDFKFRALPIYLGDEAPDAGELVEIAGYGLEGPMRISTGETFRLTVGTLKYQRYQEETGHHLVERYRGVQACFGDSGGPLYLQLLDQNGQPYWVIAGVSGSFAKWNDRLTPFFLNKMGCGVMRDFLFFSPSAQRDWLLSVLQKYGLNP
jgi:hypothetical protein